MASFLLIFRFSIIFGVFAFLAFGTQFFKPVSMSLGPMAPPTLTFGVTTPMLLSSSECIGPLVGFTTLWWMVINWTAIAVKHGWVAFCHCPCLCPCPCTCFSACPPFCSCLLPKHGSLLFCWVPPVFSFSNDTLYLVLPSRLHLHSLKGGALPKPEC